MLETKRKSKRENIHLHDSFFLDPKRYLSISIPAADVVRSVPSNHRWPWQVFLVQGTWLEQEHSQAGTCTEWGLDDVAC